MMRKAMLVVLMMFIAVGIWNPPKVAAKSKIDIVFIIDRSGSMDDDILSVKNNISAFTDKLSKQGFEYQLGLISYESYPVRYPLTSDVNTFKNNLSSIYVSGGTENGLDAIMDAINNYTFELNSYKYFVLVGDEPIYSVNGYTDAYVKQQLNNNDITLTAVGTSGVQYQFEGLSSATGGLFLYLGTGFGVNLEAIFDQIQQLPIIETIAPAPNQLLSEAHTAFVPTVRVTDPDSDQLTLEYFIEGETVARDRKTITNSKTAQLVSFKALNIGTLSEGPHTLLFKVFDGSDSVQDVVMIRVDKTPPMLQNVQMTSTTNTISISGQATDHIGGLPAEPYLYRAGSFVSPWTSATVYNVPNLNPNTAYSVSFEARDTLGHIAKSTRTLYTKAQVPAFSISKVEPTVLEIRFTDSNPLGTQIQLAVDSQYADGSGRLVSAPTWFSLPQKTLRIQGLNPNQTYSLRAAAKNGEGIATGFGSIVNGATLAHPPANLKAVASQRSISLQWDHVPNIVRYELEADGQVLQPGYAETYIHAGLSPNTQHTYRIRAINVGGASEWSAPLTVSTLPDPPPIPGIIQTTALQTEVAVTWEGVARAESYDIEADGQIIDLGNVTSYVHRGLNPETKHTYRVRAKNPGGTSEWSAAVTVDTLPYPPEIPMNLTAQLSIHTVLLNWDASERAVEYEVEVDGLIIGNSSFTSFLHEGLEPLSGHTYRVRAKNAGGYSPWSLPLDVTTHPEKPVKPSNIITTSDETSITLTWYKIPHAERYEVEVDGTLISTVDTPQFVHQGLNAESLHQYRIRAHNISGYSEWSSPVSMMTLPAGSGSGSGPMSLTNMAAVVTNTSIILSWDTVAPDAIYEIEVDGVLQNIGSNTIYQHSVLKANEFHLYKIRLMKEGEPGNWVAILALSTLPDPPDAPVNVTAFTENQSITIIWDKSEGAAGYEIEADGEIISVGNQTSYTHENLSPGTSHTYRVRASNETGVTAWSPGITQSTTTPTYTIDVAEDIPMNLSVFAYNVQDFSEMKVVVIYNPEQVELADLYNFTPKADLVSGPIPGSTVHAKVEPGKITFTFKQNLIPGQSWSGELTTITFNPKTTGTTSVDVTVERAGGLQ